MVIYSESKSYISYISVYVNEKDNAVMHMATENGDKEINTQKKKSKQEGKCRETGEGRKRERERGGRVGVVYSDAKQRYWSRLQVFYELY